MRVRAFKSFYLVIKTYKMVSATFLNVLVVLLIFVGEAFAIYAEMAAARAHANDVSIARISIQSFILILVAGSLLIAGYMFGLQSFKNIWIVSVTSVTSILIIEPVLAWTFFHLIK